jgi:microcystin-dependent protein
MPDQYTQYLQMTLPEVGASRDSWGAKWNANLTLLDELVFASMPVGAIIDFGGPQAPIGWLVCDGRLISRTTYAALFAAIGTAWGAGDGSTTFALPPTPGRAAIGAGTVIDQDGNTVAYTFGQRTGRVSQRIAQTHLPNYAMTSSSAGTHNHGGVTAPGANHTHTIDAQGSHTHTGVTDAQGSHTHTGYADASGQHNHYVGLWVMGTGAGAGSYPVMSSVFGGANYNTSDAGNHFHNLVIDAAGNHAHNLSINASGVHAHNASYSGNLQLGINGDGAHTHTIQLGGGGTLFSLTNPVLVTTKIIFAGQQAMPLVRSDAAPMSQRRLSAPMRGSH